MFSSKLTAFQNKTYTYLEENPNLQHQQCQICNIWQPRKICVCSVAKLRLIFGQWTVACQSPLSMGFSRHKYWSGLPCPPPGDLPNSGMESASPASPALQADSLPTELRGKPLYNRKAPISALLTMPQLLTVWITTNCGKFFKRWEYQTT